MNDNTRHKMVARAHSKAKARLARRYPEEYQKLLTQEMEAMGLTLLRKRRTKAEMLAALEHKVERLKADLTD